MKKKNQRNFYITGCLFSMFILWTMMVRYVDLQMIGPKNSIVGLATLNAFFHNLTGVHLSVYKITDLFSIVMLFIILYFALIGLEQLIKRKSLLKVDYDILVLGGFYSIVLLAYVLFEVFVINYRPILIEGVLEVSYPSSTTLLVMCIIPTAIMQFNKRIKNKNVRNIIKYLSVVFTVCMVIGRLISGVHWLTDIIGGVILSASFIMLYHTVVELHNQ